MGVVVEGGSIRLCGLDPWSLQWTPAPPWEVRLPHPSYRTQLHAMNVYRIQRDGRTITFAAGELSACVWGFYVPMHVWLRHLFRLLRRR